MHGIGRTGHASKIGMGFVQAQVLHLGFSINYSFPLTFEDYVHRIGRTWRAGKTGTCLV